MAADGLKLNEFLLKNIEPTIYYIPEFITEAQEESLLHHINSAPKPKWTCLSNRRLQNWGGLPHPKGMVPEKMPSWLTEIGDKIFELGVFGNKRPNHVLVNEYLPGQGIMPHEDGPLYHPVVSNVTLGSHTMLDFYKPISSATAETPEQATSLASRYEGSLLLERRSLLLMLDAMYTGHLHGIHERTTDTVDDRVLNLDPQRYRIGDTLTRSTRVSLTIRHVPKVLKVNLFGARR